MQPKSRAQFTEELHPLIEIVCILSKERHLAIHARQHSLKADKELLDLRIRWLLSEKGIDRPVCAQAAGIEIQVRQTERKPLIVAVSGKIQGPLRECANGGYPCCAFGKTEFLDGLILPALNVHASLVKSLSEAVPELAHEGANILADIDVAKESAQLVVALTQQVLADVAQEVLMAGQDRNGGRASSPTAPPLPLPPARGRA